MKSFHIGLDFGTYQSKACVYDLGNKTHEFFLFPSTNSFFIPSAVVLKKNGVLEYGKENKSTDAKSFFYFKIAAADDPEFRTVSATDTFDLNSLPYETDKFRPFTPELLSVFYITYLLFTIKEEYQRRNQKTSPKRGGGFLQRATSDKSVAKKDVNFTVQMGIPTEWSRINNLRRKRKFENLLLISEELQKRFKSRDNFTKTHAEALVNEVKNIYDLPYFKTIETFESELNSAGLSVYPETAAGLTFISKYKQIPKGYYAIMDIGGGSTDISFFHYEGKGKVKYLASESYEMASNNIYSALLEEDRSTYTMHQKEKEIINYIKQNEIKVGTKLYEVIKSVRQSLNTLARRLFAKRVYWQRKDMLKKYDGQVLIIYGGGIFIPNILSREVEVHNNGNPTSLGIPTTTLEVVNIEKYSTLKDILPADNSWKPFFHMLVVALGLSYIQHESDAQWFDSRDYRNEDGDSKNRNSLVAHPFNEDSYIYDVLLSRFR